MHTFSQQIFYALIYMGHPFLLLCASGCINSKRFGCGADQPSISIFYDGDRNTLNSFKEIIDKQRMKCSECLLNLRPLSSSPCNCTSSNGIMCCLLYFFLLITMLPYTRISLNKKNCLAFGRLRHIFVSTPSPTKTRPWIFNGYLLMKGKTQY